MSEQLPPNEVYQDIVKRFWDKKWPSVSQHDIENAWDNYVEGVERLANAEPVVSEVQLQAIRDALEPITDKIYKLGVTSGRGGALWPDEETYIDDELFLDECVSAVKAVLEGSDA